MRDRRRSGVAVGTLVASALLLLLVLGGASTGSAATQATPNGNAPVRAASATAPAAPACNSGDPYWCLSITISGNGSVTVAESGTVNATYTCPSDCTDVGIYSGDAVTLTANADAGWKFSQWSGQPAKYCSATSNPCSFTMGFNLSITASFTELPKLTVSINPSGLGGTVSSNPSGITSCSSTCTASFNSGTSVTLTAAANPGYRFNGWSGACTNTTGTCMVVMSSDRRVTATFVRVFALTISVSGNGSVGYSPAGDGTGTCNTVCTVHYDANIQVSLTATIGANATFTGWGGACTGTGTCNLTMDGDKTVTATFTGFNTLSVTVSGNGSVSGGGGTINCPGTCDGSWAAGTQVSLSAAAESGYSFAGWGGDCASAGTQSTCTLTMDSNKSVTATFSAISTPQGHRFHLKLGVTGPGKVTTTGLDCPAVCDGDYADGTSLALSAAAAAGYNFRNWDGACAPFQGDPTCQLEMDAAKEATATFTSDPVVGDGAPGADVLPPATHPLLVNVSGADGGKVTGQVFAPASAADTAPPISCGANSYACYGDYTPRSSVRLRAQPVKGFTFKGWHGACTGTQRTCTVKVNEVRNVDAAFAANGKPAAKLAMRPPSFQVKWPDSNGVGKVIVSGSVAKRARLVFDLRRPQGGPLLRLKLPVKHAGSFRLSQRIPSRLFARGARLLPGGFVASLRGKAPGAYLPIQVRTVSLRGPSAGVVRRSYASSIREGRMVGTFPASAQIAWANFRFAQQPAASLVLRVAWYWPNGRFLGSVRKANTATVSSFLRDVRALPRGCWRAELYAGSTRIKRQLVKIGTSRC